MTDEFLGAPRGAFHGANVRHLRVFRGLTQRALAQQVSASEAAVWQAERGQKPGASLVDALALVLGVEPAFFFDAVTDEFTEADCHFRKGQSSVERIRKRVLAQGTLFAHAVRYFQGRLALPKYDVPALTATTLEEIDVAAERCRDHWGLGLDAPIAHMGRVLENAGVMITRLRGDPAAKLDAFSHRGPDSGVSFVILNPAKGSTSRARFDMAHELGHLVLHTSCPPAFADKENEAERFGSAFLLPRAGFRREFRGGRVDLGRMLDLKARWKVSVQAMLHRASDLGLLDVVEFRRGYKMLSARGWLRHEPDEPPAEAPELFRRAMQTLWQRKKLGADEIARALHWTVPTFEDVTGTCAPATPHELPPGAPAPARDEKVESLAAHRLAKSAPPPATRRALRAE